MLAGCEKKFDDMFTRSDRIQKRDRQTERQTDRRTDTMSRHTLRYA